MEENIFFYVLWSWFYVGIKPNISPFLPEERWTLNGEFSFRFNFEIAKDLNPTGGMVLCPQHSWVSSKFSSSSQLEKTLFLGCLEKLLLKKNRGQITNDRRVSFSSAFAWHLKLGLKWHRTLQCTVASKKISRKFPFALGWNELLTEIWWTYSVCLCLSEAVTDWAQGFYKESFWRGHIIQYLKWPKGSIFINMLHILSILPWLCIDF